MNTTQSNKPLVCLRGIQHGNRFYTMNTPGEDPTKSAKGETWYEVLGYADSDEEARRILYPNPQDESAALTDYIAKQYGERARMGLI